MSFHSVGPRSPVGSSVDEVEVQGYSPPRPSPLRSGVHLSVRRDCLTRRRRPCTGREVSPCRRSPGETKESDESGTSRRCPPTLVPVLSKNHDHLPGLWRTSEDRVDGGKGLRGVSDDRNVNTSVGTSVNLRPFVPRGFNNNKKKKFLFPFIEKLVWSQTNLIFSHNLKVMIYFCTLAKIFRYLKCRS